MRHLDDNSNKNSARVPKSILASADLHGYISEAFPRNFVLSESADGNFSALAELLHEGIWKIDATGHTTYVNPAMAKMLGYAAPDMIGRSLFDFMDANGIKISRRYIEKRKRGESEQHDFELIHRDGHRVYVIMETTALMGDRGDYLGAIARVVDISDRRARDERSAATLLEFEFMREALYEHALVTVIDGNGVVEFANEMFCDTIGYTADELVGKPIRYVKSGIHTDAFFAEMWAVLNTGRPWRGTICDRAKDGRLVWFDTTIVGRLDENGKPAKFYGLRTDVTKRILAEQSLSQHVDELDRFAYAVAHDLKSPLQAVHKLAGWIEEETRDLEQGNDKIREFSTLMRLRLKRLDNHIDGLLRYAKYSQRAGDLIEFDLEDVVNEVFELFGVGGSFRLRLKLPLPRICGHKDRLRLVLSNLIGNAIAHHNKPTGIIEVGCIAVDAGTYEMFVRDDGPGIDPQYHGVIFEMFTTLDSRDKREGSGIGLGLVKRLLELEGGRVRIDSALGHGCTIYFTWPVDSHAVTTAILRGVRG